MVPDELLYTKNHEWIRIKGDYAEIGITEYAQSELGDVVYVELPEIEENYQQGDSFSTIEAVKAVSDVYMPISGDIDKVNSELTDNPALINKDPYGKGWIVKIKIESFFEVEKLLRPEDYEKLINE